MIYFSYNDFMDCEQNGEINEIRRIGEEIIKYEPKNIVKTSCINIAPIIEIIKDKNEFKNFLDDFLNLNTSIGDYDICYCNEIKAKTDKNKNNIITCKVKSKEIFIIVKEIDEIDVNIAYKMFEHSSNIIKQWNQEKESQKIRNPIVIPIVIYTGKKTWNTNRSMKHNNVNYIKYEYNKINFSYNMINIHEIDISELENMKSKLSEKIIELKNKYLQID